MKKRFLTCLMALSAVCTIGVFGMAVTSYAEEADTVKIGVIYPTTGSSAAIGLTCQQACIMAEEIINND